MAGASFGIGDWVSDFALPSISGKQVKLSDTVGVPVVLLFVGNDSTQESAAAAACGALAKRHEEFAALKTPILAIRRGAQGADLLDGPQAPAAATPLGLPNEAELPFPVLIDADGAVSARYGASRLRAALLHPNARVVRYYEPAEADKLADEVFDDVERIVKLETPRVVLQQAPILLIPNVLPLDFCKKLIDVWETQGNADSGFMVDAGDKTVGKFDYSAKIRKDHFIVRKSEIDETARAWVARHIIGEIAKSFNYEVTRLEDMKIACYDSGRGGYFRPHRDNTTGATAHRRFAVSMLLNDEYEGGYLRFPEYGPHLYRPQAGGAVVFGCSLLHEATDVTAGKRFVLLTFLYGEKEAKIREEYAKRAGGGYRAAGS